MRTFEVLLQMFVALFLLPILGILMGIIGGWVANLLFGKVLLEALAACGIEGIALWKLGALIGFIAVFFSNNTSSQNK